MANDRDRELRGGRNGNQGESSAGRREAAGILGERTDEEGEDAERNPWTGWAVGTVVPDETPPVRHDAAAGPPLAAEVDQRYAAGTGELLQGEDGDRADEDLLRIVIGEPRRTSLRPRATAAAAYASLLGNQTEVDNRLEEQDEHAELAGIADALVARTEGDSVVLDGLLAKGADTPLARLGLAALDVSDDDIDDFDDDEDVAEEDDGDDDDNADLDDDRHLDDDTSIELSADAPAVSRKVRPRHRRRDRPRSKTIAMKRLTREELRRGALENPPVEGVERPHTRAECRDAQRPCPWVACKHHLYLDINPTTGSIKINFPDLEPWELAHTCALDVADGGGLTLEEIGVITNLTRERVRQVEVRGLLTLKARSRSLR